METKKNKLSDVHALRPMLMAMGFCMSILTCIVAFSMKVYSSKVDFVDQVSLGDDEEIQVINTVQKQPERPKPKIEQPKIEIVENEIELPEIDVNLDPTFEEKDESIALEMPPEDEGEGVDEPFVIVENPASFPGGISAFYKFVKKNLKYPSQARRMGVEGKVVLLFIVEKDGSLTDISVVKPVGGGCDEEAVRVLSKSPRWKPGKQRGRAVRVRMYIPIQFRLN